MSCSVPFHCSLQCLGCIAYSFLYSTNTNHLTLILVSPFRSKSSVCLHTICFRLKYFAKYQFIEIVNPEVIITLLLFNQVERIYSFCWFLFLVFLSHFIANDGSWPILPILNEWERKFNWDEKKIQSVHWKRNNTNRSKSILPNPKLNDQ